MTVDNVQRWCQANKVRVEGLETKGGHAVQEKGVVEDWPVSEKELVTPVFSKRLNSDKNEIGPR